MIYTKGYCSLGLTGYEVWVDEEDLANDTLTVQYVGTQLSTPRRYKIQCRNKKKPRFFVRVNGRRLYLDKILMKY